MEPPSGFEHGTPALGIQHLNQWQTFVSTTWCHNFWANENKMEIELTSCWKESCAQNLLKEPFLMLLERLVNACWIITGTNLENGFQTCGLSPVNHKEILRKLSNNFP